MPLPTITAIPVAYSDLANDYIFDLYDIFDNTYLESCTRTDLIAWAHDLLRIANAAGATPAPDCIN